MDELTALFGSLGISSEVISIVNEDMIATARHYITHVDSQIEFSPNPICNYIDNDSLNKQILEHINLKGEKLLAEKIKQLAPQFPEGPEALAHITEIDLNSYITYYVSLLETSI